ncbi:MAG: WbuC family cupin fold metalloprotein [Bacteroidaceae bacterium]
MIDKTLINGLIEQAGKNPRRRMHFDLRTSPGDGSQRMLNVLLPDAEVPIHRHPMSNENVICLCGKLSVVLYEETANEDGEGLKETERIVLDPSIAHYGCVVPAGVWHTVQMQETAVIYEAKDGRYGEDGSETLTDY